MHKDCTFAGDKGIVMRIDDHADRDLSRRISGGACQRRDQLFQPGLNLGVTDHVGARKDAVTKQQAAERHKGKQPALSRLHGLLMARMVVTSMVVAMIIACVKIAGRALSGHSEW